MPGRDYHPVATLILIAAGLSGLAANELGYSAVLGLLGGGFIALVVVALVYVISESPLEATSMNDNDGAVSEATPAVLEAFWNDVTRHHAKRHMTLERFIAEHPGAQAWYDKDEWIDDESTEEIVRHGPGYVPKVSAAEVARLVANIGGPAVNNKKVVVAGTDSVETVDYGRSVNIIGKGKYEVVATGQMLRSDDPKAP